MHRQLRGGGTRELTAAGHTVIEVNRPNRFDRHARGKTDAFDAYSAAEAVLSGRAGAAPKGADGLVEALRVLRTTRTSALRERTATINQIKTMLIAGPEPLRARYFPTVTRTMRFRRRRWPRLLRRCSARGLGHDTAGLGHVVPSGC